MPHFKDAGTVFFVTPTHCATGRVTVSGRGRSGTVCWAPAPGLGRGLGPGCCAARLGSSRLSTLRLCQTEGRSRSRAKPAKPHQSRCLSGLLSCQRRPACLQRLACSLRPAAVQPLPRMSYCRVVAPSQPRLLSRLAVPACTAGQTIESGFDAMPPCCLPRVEKCEGDHQAAAEGRQVSHGLGRRHGGVLFARNVQLYWCDVSSAAEERCFCPARRDYLVAASIISSSLITVKIYDEKTTTKI